MVRPDCVATTVPQVYRFVWSMKNFLECNGTQKSADFRAGPGNSIWQLELNPNGEGTAADWVGIYIKLKSSQESIVRAWAKLAVLNTKKEDVHVQTFTNSFRPGEIARGLKEFVRRDLVADPSNKLLTDVDLVVVCELMTTLSQSIEINKKCTPVGLNPIDKTRIAEMASVAQVWASTNISTYNVEWRIDKFAECTTGQMISPSFSAGPAGCRWTLELRPSGDGAVYTDSIEFAVCLEQSDQPFVKASIKAALLNNAREQVTSDGFTTDFRPSPLTRHAKGIEFVRRDFVLDPLNKCLTNNRLTILCELTSVVEESIPKARNNTSENTFAWTVNHFSTCAIETIKSPSFSSCTGSLHFLQLSPNGDSNGVGYLSLYVGQTKSGQQQHKLSVKLALLSAGNILENVSEFTNNLQSGSMLGFEKFIKRSDAMKFLLKDTLTFICRISPSSETGSNNSENTTATISSQASNEQKLGDIQKHTVAEFVPNLSHAERAILENQERMFEDGKYGDCILLCNGKTLRIYKGLLAAQSAVFAQLFEKQGTTMFANKANITDVNFDVLREMVRFIYSGKTPKLEEMCEQLLEAAVKYKIDGLVELCEEKIAQKITVENAFELFSLADSYSATKLKERVVRFMDEHDLLCSA